MLVRVCHETTFSKFNLGQWYSLAQDHSDTKNPEENAQFAKTILCVRFENFENAWGGQKSKCENHQMGFYNM